MPYLGRAPTGTGSVTEIDGDLKITGQLTAQDTLFKMILDGTDGSSTNASDNIIIEDGGTDGSGTDAGDDICTEKDTSNKVGGGNIVDITGQTTGKVLQSLYSEYTGQGTLSGTIPTDASIPQVDEGNELFSQAITASSGSNTIEIVAVIYGAPQGTANTNAAIFLDGGSDAIYACQTGHDAGGGNEPANGVVRFRVSAVDTSEHTYTVRVGPNTGNYFPNSNQATNIFPGVAKCTMTVTEYSA